MAQLDVLTAHTGKCVMQQAILYGHVAKAYGVAHMPVLNMLPLAFLQKPLLYHAEHLTYQNMTPGLIRITHPPA